MTIEELDQVIADISDKLMGNIPSLDCANLALALERLMLARTEMLKQTPTVVLEADG